MSSRLISRGDRLVFADRHFTISWHAASGALAGVDVTDGPRLFDDPAPEGLRVVVGGDPAENRVPEPPGPPPLMQAGSLVPFAQPRPGERPGTLLGPTAEYDGYEIVDAGRDLVVTVWQRQAGWRFGIAVRLDRVAPVLRFDVRVRRDDGASAEVLDWVAWTSSGWTFVDGILDGLESELGYGTMKAIESAGSTVFWRSREGFGDGEFAKWGPVQPSAIAQVMGVGDLAEETVETARTVELVLYLGGDVASGTEFVGGGFHLGWSPATDAQASGVLRDYLVRTGIWGMPGIPEWGRGCHIIETTIGSWPQNPQGDAFAPYPTTEDLVADLGRLGDLGFDTIYLMPRHPFPGYTTTSIESLAAQYGDGEGTDDRFQRLVDAIHAAGMRVIVDVILHGVLDQEALDQQATRRAAMAADPVPRSSPYDWETYELAHQEPWRAEAAPVHPYWLAHPEWFTQLPDGRAQFTYTRAFDLRHPGLQEFLVDTLAGHVVAGRVDGYRFDAPWWNQRCYRWQADAGYRPSWATGAGRELISRIFDRIERRGARGLSFVESCDSTSAGSAHLQYPYDEMPVLAGLMGGTSTAAEVRQRLAYLDGVHAPGVTVAHWIDSHDSLAWAAWGRKWKREIYGLGAVRAATFLSAMRGGAFMMFSGGEEGIEEWLPRLLELRRADPVLRDGHCDELAISTDGDTLPVLRRLGDDWRIAVSSWGEGRRTVRLHVPGATAEPLVDVLDPERPLRWEDGEIVLDLDRHESALIAPRKES